MGVSGSKPVSDLQTLTNDSLKADLETSKNELYERNRLDNLVFKPFSHSDNILFYGNSQDIDISLNPRTNSYSSQEFNNLIQTRHSNSDKLSILHLRSFPSIASRILSAHNFWRHLARARVRAY